MQGLIKPERCACKGGSPAGIVSSYQSVNESKQASLATLTRGSDVHVHSCFLRLVCDFAQQVCQGDDANSLSLPVDHIHSVQVVLHYAVNDLQAQAHPECHTTGLQDRNITWRPVILSRTPK